MSNSIKKSIAKELAVAATENTFATIAIAAGFPALALVTPLAKGLILGLVENCFNNCAQMTLSVNEKKKLNQVSTVALQTFWELAEKDGVVAWEMNIDPTYIDYAYEVAEHATLEAIRQSEKKKIDVLGHYYGKQFYKGESDWQDMHQMITMVGYLTYRQIVLIRLISEGFKGIDGKLFISNPAACVEVNRLKDYGIWQTEGAAFGINEAVEIQIDSIIATRYSDIVTEALMLDRISEEDFKKKTTFTVDGEQLILPDGKRYGGNPDEDMFLYDLARGK